MVVLNKRDLVDEAQLSAVGRRVKAINPAAAEACNDLDDDCNSLVDDGLSSPLVDRAAIFAATSSRRVFKFAMTVARVMIHQTGDGRA